ncbi:Zinc finger BED domain-containing protein RICESLEEPER 2 [Bienertia sinuspersici]
MKKPKNYKWQKNDGTSTMSRHLRSEHGLGPEGEEGSSGKFIIADELPYSSGESSNDEYFNRVALQPQYRKYGLRKKVIALDTTTRWNSTYKLLHDAITYRDVLTDMYNESRATDGQFITNDHWSLAKIFRDVLETFDNATHMFSYVYEPNIHMLILECIKIICTIEETSLANPGAAVKRLLDNMKVKWCAYFTEFPPIYAIAAILDPGVKLEDVQFDVPHYVNNFKRILERLCEDYGAVIQPQPVGSSMGASRFGILGPVLKK